MAALQRQTRPSSTRLCAALVASLVASLLAARAMADEQSFTKPSESRDVTFSVPGVVAIENVKEGDSVSAGQVLAQQDTSVEEAELKTASIDANSNLQHDAAVAEHNAKDADLKRKTKMLAEHVVGEEEYDEAKADEAVAAVRIELADQEKAKAQAQAEEAQAKINLKTLKSPISGVVSKINTHVGEAPTSDATKPVMTIIQNDPLYVDVDLDTAVVKNVRPKQILQLYYVGEEHRLLDAQVIFISPEANASADKQMVRLQLPNPDGRSSGLQVKVKVPSTETAAAGN